MRPCEAEKGVLDKRVTRCDKEGEEKSRSMRCDIFARRPPAIRLEKNRTNSIGTVALFSSFPRHLEILNPERQRSRVTMSATSDLPDLHEICIEGDYSALKDLLERRKDVERQRVQTVCLPPKSDQRARDGRRFRRRRRGVPVRREFHRFRSDVRLSLSPLLRHLQQSSRLCQTTPPIRCQSNSTEVRPSSLPLTSSSSWFSCRPWGLNALCLATYLGHHRLVEYFLHSGFNANETDKPNGTDHYFHSLPSTPRAQAEDARDAFPRGTRHGHVPLSPSHRRQTRFHRLGSALSSFQIQRQSGDERGVHEEDASARRSGEIFHRGSTRPLLPALHPPALLQIIRLLLEEGHVNENPSDLNGHTPLDIVWKILNNLDYQFEYREETLKLMLSHRCRFSSLRSLTEFYANSLSAFRRFESNFWIVIAYHLPSLFLEPFPNNKALLVHIWIWFNRN